jgi:predicted DNA-binding antitoxin AbrB/MazE fold protein
MPDSLGTWIGYALSPGVRLDSLCNSRQVISGVNQEESLMTKHSHRTIDAVYEEGVFRPTRKVGLPEQSRVRLTLVPISDRSVRERKRVVERQRKALLKIAGMGTSGHTDISENPHHALYGARRAP